MVSTEEKRKLLERIKNEPKHYEIRLEGKGCETVMGFITKEAYRFWSKKKDKELGNYLSQYRDMNMLGKIPAKAQLQKEWYEHDDIAHVSGVLLNSSNKIYIDQYNSKFQLEDTVFRSELDLNELAKKGIRMVSTLASNYDAPQMIDKHFFFGISKESGCWYTEEKIKTKLYDFDLQKLWLRYSTVNGVNVIHEIEYDGLEYYLTADTKGLEFDIGVKKGISYKDFGKKNMKNIWINS